MPSRIFLATLLIFNILATTGCALFGDHHDTAAPVEDVSEVFVGSFDEVWRALQKALISYPISVNNIDKGVIETDILKDKNVWRPPYVDRDKRLGYRYVLTANVLRGKSRSQDSVRVTITKNISVERDFFSGDQKLYSDGLEEKVILYRISREIKIERALKKAFDRGA